MEIENEKRMFEECSTNKRKLKGCCFKQLVCAREIERRFCLKKVVPTKKIKRRLFKAFSFNQGNGKKIVSAKKFTEDC